MTAHYLDPSAWVKRYFEEPGSSVIASIFADTELVCCSSIGIVEVAATISRKGVAKYNPLIRISAQLGETAVYGSKFWNK